jgi:hypothetical protein
MGKDTIMKDRKFKTVKDLIKELKEFDPDIKIFMCQILMSNGDRVMFIRDKTRKIKDRVEVRNG